MRSSVLSIGRSSVGHGFELSFTLSNDDDDEYGDETICHSNSMSPRSLCLALLVTKHIEELCGKCSRSGGAVYTPDELCGSSVSGMGNARMTHAKSASSSSSCSNDEHRLCS